METGQQRKTAVKYPARVREALHVIDVSGEVIGQDTTKVRYQHVNGCAVSFGGSRKFCVP